MATGSIMRSPGHIDRAPRVAAQVGAVLIDANGHQLAAVVTDISKGGFRVSTGEPLMIGECVVVRVGRSEFRAQIRWANENEAGGYFLEAVDLS
jgi:hypothetical protein